MAGGPFQLKRGGHMGCMGPIRLTMEEWICVAWALDPTQKGI